jgi:GST-like protein
MKTGRFLPADPRGRKEAMEWMFWQVGNQGPMAGQLSHFVNYAPEGTGDYGRPRYAREYDRCLGVPDRRLEGRDRIVGHAYSIADMIAWPWVLIAKPLAAALEPFPHLRAWLQRAQERPAVQRGVDHGKEWRRQAPPSDEERRLLFEQSSASLRPVTGEDG